MIGKSACFALLICGTAATLRGDQPTKPAAIPNAVSTKAAAAKAASAKDRVVRALQQTAEAMRSRSIEPAEHATFRELLAAADALAKDKNVALMEREKWRGIARGRLAEGADLLRRQLARKPANVRPPLSPVLAQQGLGGLMQPLGGMQAQPGNAGPSAEQQEAEALMELITGAIRPESWEDNGGEGVIRYWSLGHAIIIHNTADVHEKVGGTVGLLRQVP
jgi:hypothetical protein